MPLLSRGCFNIDYTDDGAGPPVVRQFLDAGRG